MIIFEDNGENVDIRIENAISDNPTVAQSAVLELFRRIKEIANQENAIIDNED